MFSYNGTIILIRITRFHGSCYLNLQSLLVECRRVNSGWINNCWFNWGPILLIQYVSDNCLRVLQFIWQIPSVSSHLNKATQQSHCRLARGPPISVSAARSESLEFTKPHAVPAGCSAERYKCWKSFKTVGHGQFRMLSSDNALCDGEAYILPKQV